MSIKKILAAGSAVALISFVIFQAPILKSAEATSTTTQSVIIDGNRHGGSSNVTGNNNIAYGYNNVILAGNNNHLYDPDGYEY